MTKVIILGQEPKEQKQLKKIKLEYTLRDGQHCVPMSNLNDFDFIELVAKNAYKYNNIIYDLMYAYDSGCRDSYKNTSIYIGHFNDGVV